MLEEVCDIPHSSPDLQVTNLNSQFQNNIMAKTEGRVQKSGN